MKNYIKQIFKFNEAEALLEISLACSICMGMPLLIGAYFNQLQISMAACIGGMVFFYTPKTKIYHRMVVVMACSFGMIASFCLGYLCSFNHTLLGLTLGMIVTLSSMICRFYQINIPGNLFFTMSATIAAYMPFGLQKLPSAVGVISFGTIFACFVAFIYSLLTINKTEIHEIKSHVFTGFEEVIAEPLIIGIFVGVSVFIAEIIGLDRAYWVPISCLVIMKGMTLQSTWIKQLQRIIGTILGLTLTWFLLKIDHNAWTIAISITILSFLTQFFVLKNYVFAMIFITPMTIFMAEISGSITNDMNLITTRLIDIILGSFIGFVGGVFLHNVNFRKNVSKFLKMFSIFKFLFKNQA